MTRTLRASENGVGLTCQLGGYFARLRDCREVAVHARSLNLVAVLPQFIVHAVEALDDQSMYD